MARTQKIVTDYIYYSDKIDFNKILLEIEEKYSCMANPDKIIKLKLLIEQKKKQKIDTQRELIELKKREIDLQLAAEMLKNYLENIQR